MMQVKKPWFIVRTPADLEIFYELAGDEPEISQDVLQSLKNMTKIIFFPKRSEPIPPSEE